MRKLASIQKVEWVKPIEGRDRIELIGVLGWQVIVKKDEFKVGDSIIFVEPDSVLPDKPEYEFLRSKKFRIKTMKMGGVLSQGICFPLSVLPNGNYKLEDDVTELMGITKYEPNVDNREPVEIKSKNPIVQYLMRYAFFRKIFLPKKQQKGFPTFISKTDETRIQNIPSILDNKNLKYIAREKVDGQSGTFFLKRIKKGFIFKRDAFEFGVCSRNLRLFKEDNSSYWSVARKYDIENVLKDLIGDNEFVAIQGECIASNVQGNKYNVTEPDLYVFNLIYPNEKVLCLVAEPILANYGIKWCPLVATDFTLLDTVNEMLDLADGQSKIYPTLREGLVFRNYDKNISFKAVSPKWLIKHDE